MGRRRGLGRVKKPKIAPFELIDANQLTFGHPFQPVHLQVAYRDQMPVLLE